MFFPVELTWVDKINHKSYLMLSSDKPKLKTKFLPWNSLIKELFKKFTKPFQSLKVTFEISAEIKPKKYKSLLYLFG